MHTLLRCDKAYNSPLHLFEQSRMRLQTLTKRDR